MPSGDLRPALLALSAWAGALGGFLLPGRVAAGAACVLAAGLIVRWRRGRPVLVLTICLLAAAAVACSASLRAEATQTSPVADLARQRAFVTMTVDVTSDPMLREGRHDSFVVVRGRAVAVTGRGRAARTRVPVLVIGDRSWQRVELASRVRLSGRLSPADGEDLSAVVSTSRPPVLMRPPGVAFDGVAGVRAGLRESVSGLPEAERALIPALVVGDDQGMPEDVVESFQVSGLTHLLAVSGTNLTLVVGSLLVLARWAGVRARGLVFVGILGVAGFVLLARAEPSVVRAAAMGSVALIGMTANGRQRGVRALGVAVFLLLLFDPRMATSLGFVLSALATAGIVFLAPVWRDALMRWLPRWLAELVAVPMAAQLACTPVVAAISAQVSLAAVAANMIVAPVVGPATVCGLLAGFVSLVVPVAGQALGQLAGWCAWWIVTVAGQTRRLPNAAVGWGADAWSVGVLTAVCALLALAMPWLLGRRVRALAGSGVLVTAVLLPMPSPGWPPDGWAMVVCDVGQGDGIVLDAGGGSAVVVDVGPDPAAMDRCLDRLGVERVPVLVLSHFHADHVAGLAAVLGERSVGEVLVSALPVPAGGAAFVAGLAERARVPVRVPAYGETGSAGDLTWQIVGPARQPSGSAYDEGSLANNSSLALVADVRGVRIMLTGDVEPEAQRLLDRSLPGLAVDVLKVPHHGSRHQDLPFLTALGARLAVVSVAADNDYGHPAAETLDGLREAGMLVRRTDEDGDIAVVVDRGMRVVTSGRRPGSVTR